jgi:hypothetical protein
MSDDIPECARTIEELLEAADYEAVGRRVGAELLRVVRAKSAEREERRHRREERRRQTAAPESDRE